MKKNLLSFAFCLSAALIWSCNNSSDSSNTGTDTGTHTGDTSNMNSNTSNMNNTNTTPLSKDDSAFVMEAAMGGMMEVQAGQLAQQNGASQRVKDFGNMMVTDHSKANDELKGLVSGRISIPDSLPADMKKHLDAMRNMKGAAFDKHYITMMNDDHKKDIGKFQKEANNGGDAQLKSWAGNTLPVLQKHMDSVTAIKKGM